jgi:hypothetical protein
MLSLPRGESALGVARGRRLIIFLLLTSEEGNRCYIDVTKWGRNGRYLLENYWVEVIRLDRCEECVRRLMEGLLVSRSRAVQLVDILAGTGGKKDPHDHASVELVGKIRGVQLKLFGCLVEEVIGDGRVVDDSGGGEAAGRVEGAGVPVGEKRAAASG